MVKNKKIQKEMEEKKKVQLSKLNPGLLENGQTGQIRRLAIIRLNTSTSACPYVQIMPNVK